MLPFPAPGSELPEHVRQRLLRDYQCREVAIEKRIPADVVYVAPDQPHQLTFYGIDDLSIRVTKSPFVVDAYYTTRLQKERRPPGEEVTDYQVVDRRFLDRHHFRRAQVMHPLPRVDELSYDLDTDKRGVYFKQASFGVPVRMALIAALLGLVEGMQIEGNKKEARYEQYSQELGVACENPNCVTAQESERRYLRGRFWLIPQDKLTLRCSYCDFEVHPDLAGRLSRRKLLRAINDWVSVPKDDVVFFRNTAEAYTAGFATLAEKRRKGTSIQGSGRSGHKRA
jgi:hypothetical protein